MAERFQLEGFYLYDQLPSGKGKLTGEIQLERGVFEGEVYDHGSVAPRQAIMGHLNSGAGLDRLTFVKLPPRTNLANLAYSLSRDFVAGREGFEGTYKGEWGAMPFKIAFDRDYGVFVASVDMNMRNIGDSAEITLTRN